MDLTYFNPNLQKESDFLMGFVARQHTLDFFLKQLHLVPADGAGRHHLIVAPRGFGKTSLLRRIAIGVRNDEKLNMRFIALRFREEQHNVISLDIFWRNCLQSLAEAREDEGAPAEEIATLDTAWERHAPRQALSQEEQDGEPAREIFHAFCEKSQRRPLLLIDNLDTLLAGLTPRHQWSLRSRLQSDDGPILIAAASRYPAATHDQDAAFYEFFRIYSLEKLKDEEVFACLRNLAIHRGILGQPVLKLLAKDPGRVVALNIMAGGNPRTLSVLYGVLESHMSADVLSQLNAMLDTFTGWYQARTEELPIQARAVFDALALNWDPMTAAALGLATGLGTSAASSQLTRLEKANYVESVPLSKRGKGRNGYQVSERFFNIWYLMRNGPRRAKQNIFFLTKFLQSCFSSAELRSHAISLLKNGVCDPDYTLALASSFKNGRLREQLIEQAYIQSSDSGQKSEYDSIINELRNDGQKKLSVIERKPEKIEQLMRGYDDIIARFDAAPSPSLREQVAKALFNKGLRFANQGQSNKAIEVYDDIVARFGDATEIDLREYVCKALFSKGVRLGILGQSQEAIMAYEEVIARFDAAPHPVLRKQVAKALVNKGARFSILGQSEEAIIIYDEVVARFGSAIENDLIEQVARALVNKGSRLNFLGQSEKAIAIYDDIIARFGDATESGLRESVARALVHKGSILGNFGQSDGEIAIYDEVLARFGTATEYGLREQVARALVNKGATLSKLGQSEQAITIYDEVAARFDGAQEPALSGPLARALVNKGVRLGVLGRPEQAILVFEDVIARFGSSTDLALREQVARAIVNKGSRLGELGQSEEEIAIYNEVVDRFGTATESGLREQVARALFNKGARLSSLDKSEEAIIAYDDVINRFGVATEFSLREQVAMALVNKGIRLTILGQSENAILIYDDVVSRFGSATEDSLREKVARALANKAERLNYLKKPEEAIATYDHVVARFSMDTQLGLREQVAKSIFRKAVIFSNLGQSEKEIATYNEFIDLFGSTDEDTFHEQVAVVLINKAITLNILGKSENSINTYDYVIDRFSKATDLRIQEQVVKALLNKGFQLSDNGKSEEAIEIYDDIFNRFGAITDLGVRQYVVGALDGKASLLRKTERFDASISTYQDAIKWDKTQSSFYVGLGNLLLDSIGDIENALKVFNNGLDVVDKKQDRVLLDINIAYAIALHDGDIALARKHAISALEDETTITPSGRLLAEALPIWSDRNIRDWQCIFENIGKALNCEDPELWVGYADDIERLLWFIISNEQGENFKIWMENEQFHNRYSPLYHAFVAALRGEDHLFQINPETRQPAQIIYKGINQRMTIWASSKLNSKLK